MPIVSKKNLRKQYPTQSSPLKISLDQLHNVSFDAVVGPAPKSKRNFIRQALKAATIIPGQSTESVTIVFKSVSHGLLKIRSRILAIGTSYVALPGGTMIPLKSIKHVAL